VLIAAALGCLVAAGAAYAAINTYTAKLTFTTKKAGTNAKPIPAGYTENLTATGTNGNRTGVLQDITTKIYGLREDGKDFPTCTINKIKTAHTDAKCPKGAEVASGFITATIGSALGSFSNTGYAPNCNPLLDVWNSGQGKLTFFFVDKGTHQCGGGAIKTGGVAPYPATYKEHGDTLVIDVPIPGYVGFPLPGVAGSLDSEHLVWAKRTKKLKSGKTVASIASVACTKKARPYSVTFKAAQPDPTTGNPGKSETDTVAGTAVC
jgi:hypothetical protein